MVVVVVVVAGCLLGIHGVARGNQVQKGVSEMLEDIGVKGGKLRHCNPRKDYNASLGQPK
jgi:hypothetical protein